MEYEEYEEPALKKFFKSTFFQCVFGGLILIKAISAWMHPEIHIVHSSEMYKPVRITYSKGY